MSKIYLSPTRREHQLLTSSLYSYEYIPSKAQYCYEIIGYGFENLDPLSFKKINELPSLIEESSLKKQFIFEFETKSLSKLKTILQLYQKNEILKAPLTVDTTSKKVLITSLEPLSKVKSFCTSVYLQHFLLNALRPHNILKSFKIEGPFETEIALTDETKADFSLGYTKEEVKRFKNLYLPNLKKNIRGYFLKNKKFKIPSYMLYSSLEDSFLYYLQSNTTTPVVTHEPLSKELKNNSKKLSNNFYSALNVLDYPFFSFNHLTDKGVPLLNPIPTKVLCFEEKPFLSKKLKDLPPNGFTFSSGFTYIWDLKSKKNLSYLKNAITLFLSTTLQPQELNNEKKIKKNVVSYKKGFIKEASSYFFIKLKI